MEHLLLENTRETKQRKLILDVVLQRYDHPTAEKIYEEVRKKNKRISKGTVYRNLNILSYMGKIRHIEIPGSDRFDSTIKPHHHVYCVRCGKVEDVDIAYNYYEDKKIEKKMGYKDIKHSMVFEGICASCKKVI